MFFPILCSEWCEEYNTRIPDVKNLQMDIDKYMAIYDKRVEQQIAKEKAAGEEDEDGWVTVTKR